MVVALEKYVTDFVWGHGRNLASTPTTAALAAAIVISGCAIIVGAVGGAVGFLALPAALILAGSGAVPCVGCILFIVHHRTGGTAPKGDGISGNSAGPSQQKPGANPQKQTPPGSSGASGAAATAGTGAEPGAGGGVGAGGAGENPVISPAGETPSASPEPDIQPHPPGPTIPPATSIAPILPDPQTADLPPQKWVLQPAKSRICMHPIPIPRDCPQEPITINDHEKYSDAIKRAYQIIERDSSGREVALKIDLGSFGPDDIGARISDLLECPELWPSIHSFNIMHGGLTPIEWANLQKLIPGLAHLHEFSIDGGGCELPPDVARALFGLKELEIISFDGFTKIEFPANCGTSMANFYVRNCASFNPGGLFTTESLKSLTLYSVVWADQDCQADFTHLEKFTTDVATTAQNEKFFGRAEFPKLQILEFSTSGLWDLSGGKKPYICPILGGIAKYVKRLVILPLDHDHKFGYGALLSSCEVCESIQFGTWVAHECHLWEFAGAVIAAKKAGKLSNLKVLHFPAGDFELKDPTWCKLLEELKKIPNLKIEEPPKNS